MVDSDRFWSKVDQSASVTECWPWMGARHRAGYGAFGVRHQRADYAHRVAWRLTYGEIPAGLQVLHLCDNPPCVNPAHLILGTQLANIRDMDAKGRRINAPQLGERNGNAKLTAETVREIRRRRAAGEPRKAVAAAFGVSESAVKQAINGRTWRHV